VKEDNRDLLRKTEAIEGEATGSALIAEYKKLLFNPYVPHWVIELTSHDSGERRFRIKPYRKGLEGLWYFRDYLDARHKLRGLEGELRGESYAYREGGKSKEEILRHNQKAEALARQARFPAENLLILGEGRTHEERSLILVRDGHVLGYGYTEASESEVIEHPERYLNRRFFKHLGVDLTTKRYIRELKHMRQKSDSWRALAQVI
jgi:hypothetical protein